MTLKSLFEYIIPPAKWQVPVIISLGIFTGLLMNLINISNALSYLSDSPETCVNCHVMRSEYTAWQHSSHRNAATCNDCHVPHNNIVRKYFFKAKDGLRHATIFTLRAEPQVIHMKEAGRTVVQENCLRCHYNLVNAVSITNVTAQNYQHGEGLLCWNCHRYTPHGRVHSLASVPYTLALDNSPLLPKWLRYYLGLNKKTR